MSQKLKIVVAGQKRFGRDVFEMLREEGHDVVSCACPVGLEKPDKLWIAADNSGVRVVKAGSLTYENCPECDLIVAAHSHDFIGRKTMGKARLGAIGYHPSLLPLHRGRDAVRWTVRMGDKVSGGSVYWLSETVDGGPLAAQKHVFVRPGDTASELWSRDLAPMGVEMLRGVVRDIASGRIVRQEQDHGLATWEPSFSGCPPMYRPELPQLTYGGGFEKYVNQIA